MGVWAARIWLRVSSVGIPRSITQVRWAFPYCFSIFFRKSAKVVSSGVLPRPDLIGQWKAIRSHDQGDHHLHAIWTFVAAVTKFSFTFLGRIRFKIGTGQIVEQHLETHIEQRLPALLEIGKQVLLMGQQLVQTPIQLVDLHQTKILPQRITPRTLFIPVPVQPPLTPRIDQAVTDQGLKHIQPPRPLATGGQFVRPKLIQPQQTSIGRTPIQLIPQLTGQPAGAPLPGTVQLQLTELDAHNLTVQSRRPTVFREDRHLLRLGLSLLEHLDRLTPGGVLMVVNLPQIQHLPLDNTIPPRTPVFHNTPIAMYYSVF